MTFPRTEYTDPPRTVRGVLEAIFADPDVRGRAAGLAAGGIAILDAADEFHRAVIDSPRDEHGEPAYVRCRCIPDPKGEE